MISPNDPQVKVGNGSSAHYATTPHLRTSDSAHLRTNIDAVGSHSTPRPDHNRRRSLVDHPTPNGSPTRRKSVLDTLSVDPQSNNMGEDLGFQWAPSIRLRPPKSASLFSRQSEPFHNHLVQDASHLTPPENGLGFNDFSRPPTRMMNDENSNETHREHRNTVYFNDGRKRIDYVLVYDQGVNETPNDESISRRRRSAAEKEKLRQFFQENLRKDGLQLEEDIVPHASDNRAVTVFVKVHGTWAALCRQAEILKIKMPLRLRDTFSDQKATDAEFGLHQFWFRRFCRLAVAVYKKLIRGRLSPEEEIKMNAYDEASQQDNYGFVTWPFQTNKIDKYAIADQDSFFSPTQRMEMVWEILQTSRNDPNDEKKRGIEKLLDMGIYDSAFPLHDGPATVKNSLSSSLWCERQRLRETWASWKCVFEKQPLALIRRYYGEKVGFYFAFLGFYTKMLAIPGLIGLCTFFYGLGYAADDELVQDVCNAQKEPGNFTMCPICRPPNCEFTQLSESCTNTEWDYRMDNEATVIMAAVTVIWATVFMKAWKRREAELAYEWDVYEVQQVEGVIRPDYEERAPSTRRNPVTRESEPYVPWSTRYWWLMCSACITVFMLFAVVGALGGLVLARVALYGLFRNLHIHHSVELARWFVHLLIFIVVVVFDAVYGTVGRKATTLECPRTQAQWLSSFLWKLFIFELLNDFVPIGYAAWLKGMSIRTPLDLTWKSELCDSGGCMGEVTELIAVLLLARLAVGNGLEIGIPFLKHVFAKTVSKRKIEHEAGRSGQQHKCQWRSDRLLNELELDGVADEYMEMIVQFAFVTLFVPAFPVAPLVCLLNNILEIRVDATKFIVSHRRPLPIRVPGIQIWNEFLNIVAKLAILCNGALMSFTSGMIPRLYYKYAVHNGQDYNGFVQYSLSHIPREAWYHRNITNAYHEFLIHNISRCYYQHHRHPEESMNFDLTTTWWQITCVRLAAFCVFISAAYIFQWFYDFLVPDVPSHITLKMQRRRYVVQRAMEAEILTDKWLRHSAHTNTNSDHDHHSEAEPGAACRNEDVPLTDGDGSGPNPNPIHARDLPKVAIRSPDTYRPNP